MHRQRACFGDLFAAGATYRGKSCMPVSLNLRSGIRHVIATSWIWIE